MLVLNGSVREVCASRHVSIFSAGFSWRRIVGLEFDYGLKGCVACVLYVRLLQSAVGGRLPRYSVEYFKFARTGGGRDLHGRIVRWVEGAVLVRYDPLCDVLSAFWYVGLGKSRGGLEDHVGYEHTEEDAAVIGVFLFGRVLWA